MINEFLLDKMKDIREEHDIKQKDLAKKLNVSQPNYARWETKAKIIPLRKLNELCNYFEINMDYIIGISNKKIKMKNNNVLDKKIIGQNIKKIREENNLSQKEIANMLHTTQSVISAYEAGKTLILTAFAMEICLKYNVSLDKLCNRK